jgi:DNA-binding GntR family transcriptional regulator
MRNRRKLRSEKAYQEIKSQIACLKLSPGTQIDESTLGRSLGMGRTPVREALLRLVAEQLVEMVPNSGFFVRHVTLVDVRDLFEAMLTLQRASIPIATRRIKPDQIKELRKTNVELKEAWLKREFLEVTMLNSQFHRIINEATGNVFLESYLNNLQDQSQRLAYLCYSKGVGNNHVEAHAELTFKDHEALIQLLEKYNEVEAVEVMRNHIKLFHDRVLRYAGEAIEFDRTGEENRLLEKAETLGVEK